MEKKFPQMSDVQEKIYTECYNPNGVLKNKTKNQDMWTCTVVAA